MPRSQSAKGFGPPATTASRRRRRDARVTESRPTRLERRAPLRSRRLISRLGSDRLTRHHQKRSAFNERPVVKIAAEHPAMGTPSSDFQFLKQRCERGQLCVLPTGRRWMTAIGADVDATSANFLRLRRWQLGGSNTRQDRQRRVGAAAGFVGCEALCSRRWRKYLSRFDELRVSTEIARVNSTAAIDAVCPQLSLGMIFIGSAASTA